MKRLFTNGLRQFRYHFKENPSHAYAAPGRVEIIGNHVDYQGGSVISLALEKYVLCLLRVNDANDKIKRGKVNVFLTAFKKMITFNISEIQDDFIPKSTNSEDLYIKGLIAQIVFSQSREKISLLENGFEAVVIGDIPIGEGVSSSAAFLVSLLTCILESIHLKLTFFEKIHLIRMTEHRIGNFAGHQDQTVSLTGGILLVKPEGQKPIPIKMHPNFEKFKFLLFRSGISRSLSDNNSQFALRVAECNEALKIINKYLLKHNLKTVLNISSLVDSYYSHADIGSIYKFLNKNLAKRIKHIMEETKRVDKAYKAITNGKVEEFAQLLNESGESSANLYEVSHPKVEELKKQIYNFFAKEKRKYIFAARMMGGGNGGMVLAFVPKEKKLIQRLQSYLRRNYYNQKKRDNFTPIEVTIIKGPINLTKYI
ncbi:hypothetical protein HY029_00375 [Candidatus Gottesmanbacteria bacterium]|nr:hypothetical protein [Candidatus Gottesmanbacteria bacterium]